MVTVPEPHDLQHLNFWNILVVIEAFTVHLFLGSALAGKLGSNNISGFPLIAKEIPVYCNQYILYILNTKQLYIDKFFAILYYNVICSQTLKNCDFFFSISIILSEIRRTIPLV